MVKSVLKEKLHEQIVLFFGNTSKKPSIVKMQEKKAIFSAASNTSAVSKPRGKHICFACPSSISLHHPMADLLLEHAQKGCTLTIETTGQEST